MVSQIESGRLSPSLHTLGKDRLRVGVPTRRSSTASRPAASSSRNKGVTIRSWSFDGSSERWAVLAQASSREDPSGGLDLGPKSRGFTTEKVIIKPGQMKLFYVLEGKVALHYNGDRHLLEAGDSALLDGGVPQRLGESRRQAGPGPLGHPG